MAQTANLQAAVRRDTGKGAARSLRREGKVPAVIYGHHREPEALVLEAPAVGRLLKSGHASTTMIELAIDGRAAVKAMLREVQRNPVKQHEILHVDLYEVTANEKITVSLPVHLVGTAEGVRNAGGVLDQVLHALDVKMLPGDIPDALDVDIAHLGIGQSLYVRDIKVAKGDVLNDADLPVCSIVAPRTEVEAPVAAEPVSGEPELIRKAKADETAE